MGISVGYAGLKQLQIISDGENLFIILPGDGGVLSVKQALFKDFTLNRSAGDMIDTTEFGDLSPRPYINNYPPFVEGILKFCSVDEVNWLEKGPGLFDLNFFRNATVRDLFKMINKKLETRS